MADSTKNPFMDMFQNFGQSMNIPGPDLNAMMDAHRKNLQALQAAAQIGSNSAQAMMDKQREMLEDALAEIAETVQSAGTDPSAAMSSSVDLAKKSFDATMKNTSEIAQIVQQGNMEAYNILKDRVMESVEELNPNKKS